MELKCPYCKRQITSDTTTWIGAVSFMLGFGCLGAFLSFSFITGFDYFVTDQTTFYIWVAYVTYARGILLVCGAASLALFCVYLFLDWLDEHPSAAVFQHEMANIAASLQEG